MCVDDLVSSLFWPLSFEDADILAAFETCTDNWKHGEMPRVSRNVNKLLDKMLVSFIVKIWWVVRLTFPFLFFVLTPQVLQAPWVPSSELWAGYPPVHHEDWLYFCPLEVHMLYEFTLSSISLPSPSILSSLLENKNFRLGLWLFLSFLLEHQCHLCVLPKQITVGYFALQRSTPLEKSLHVPCTSEIKASGS